MSAMRTMPAPSRRADATAVATTSARDGAEFRATLAALSDLAGPGATLATVEAAVREELAAFADAPIRTFVPVLAARRVRHRMRAHGSTRGRPRAR